ncbi:MAG: HDOD domain-containing protein [Phycisphaerales bacterium]|nr:HDOD domain-containing protein [Phycisphaerales bacterium]
MTAQAQTGARETAVNSAIREISHIATLPEITLKIIELVESPTSTAQDLHKVIANDPALCSRILKVVNSAFYGLPGQIGSINRAIVLLGLNAVKNIAIAASLAKLFRGGSLTPEFSAKDLWSHSIATAAACKMTADAMKLGLSDEAFLAGLIHDIGIIVEIQYDRHKLIETLGRVTVDGNGAPTVNMLDVEAEVFGANHQDFGQGLCDKWKFPRSFALVTGFHHRPLELANEQRTLVTIVSVADRIAGAIKPGFRLDQPSIEVPPDLLDVLKLTREQAADIANRLPQQIETVNQMLTT